MQIWENKICVQDNRLKYMTFEKCVYTYEYVTACLLWMCAWAYEDCV